jgi:hypothetical protein
VPELGRVERGVERIAHSVVEQVPADLVAEGEISGVGEVLAPAESVERDDGLVGERDAADVV